jgi:hypothetical protein
MPPRKPNPLLPHTLLKERKDKEHARTKTTYTPPPLRTSRTARSAGSVPFCCVR